MEYAEILKFHANKYPDLTPQDVIKLIYQSVYGCAHFVDAGRAVEYIRQEMSGEERSSEPLFEPIGNGRARLMLNSPEAKTLSPELIVKIFAASAKSDAERKNTDGRFEECLAAFLNEAKKGTFAFSHHEAEYFVEEYMVSGGGAVHHSEQYRERYAPAYRVFSPVAVKSFEACKLAHKMIKSGREPKIALLGDDEAALANARQFISSVFGDSVHFVKENYDAGLSFDSSESFIKA